MNIIKTGIGITKTIKNVSRFREVLSVFAKHGFDEFIINSNLHLVIPDFVIPKSRYKKNDESSEYAFWQSVGTRLRQAFEELGPSFIKMGQLLSTREDILDPLLITELKKLQNNVRPLPFKEIKKRIELELGDGTPNIFEYIEESPIGVASIGLVYKAKLKSGEDVVVKVRRPNIRKTLLQDFELMAFIVGRIEKSFPELKYMGLSRAIEDFFKGIQLEVNFLIEANNSRKIKEVIEAIDEKKILQIPKIYPEYSTSKVLVMEYLEGTPFNQLKNIEEHNDLQEKLINGVKLFMHNMLSDGVFHADLHGGNFFLLNNDKIGLIDFGLVGHLSKQNRTSLIAILFALLSNNYENLVLEFLDIAEYEDIPNAEILTRDIRDALTPFIGMSVQELDATALFHAIVETLGKHQVYLPREWFIIFRALMTLDGVGKSLRIDLNIFDIIESEIRPIMSDMISKDALIEESAWLTRDMLNSMRIVPRHIKWLLKDLAKKKYQIDLKFEETNKEINFLSRSIYFLGMTILSATFFIGGIIIINDLTVTHLNQIPIVTYVCWGLSIASFIRANMLLKLK